MVPHNSTDTTDPVQQSGCIPSPGVRPEPNPWDPWDTGGTGGGHTTCIPTDSPTTGDGTARGTGGPGRSKKPRNSGSPGQGEGVTGEPPGTVQQLNRGENENNGENGINAYNIGENEENIGGNIGENIGENEENNVSREGRRGRGYKATKIVTLNIQGLLNRDKYKVEQLNDIATDLSPAVICIQETWLKTNHTLTETKIQGYSE